MNISVRKIGIISFLFLLGVVFFINLHSLPENQILSDKISKHILQSGLKETGSSNLITAILYDYRAFDSLGESTVIFAAVSGIVLILSRKLLPVSSHGLSFITKRSLGIITPFAFLFSLYIITHAHLSPGGGFQGGVILGTISIIFSIVYGSAFDYKRYSSKLKTSLETGGALLFIIIGLMGIAFEGAFLDNLNFLTSKTEGFFSAGSIPIINLGIGFKIGAGLAIIFYSMIQKTFNKEGDN